VRLREATNAADAPMTPAATTPARGVTRLAAWRDPPGAARGVARPAWRGVSHPRGAIADGPTGRRGGAKTASTRIIVEDHEHKDVMFPTIQRNVVTALR
jgi:hypothetical protein